MKAPPLCKCQKCGNACLWITTLCSACIREIEDQQKAEEATENHPSLFGFKMQVDHRLPDGVAQIRDGASGETLHTFVAPRLKGRHDPKLRV